MPDQRTDYDLWTRNMQNLMPLTAYQARLKSRDAPPPSPIAGGGNGSVKKSSSPKGKKKKEGDEKADSKGSKGLDSEDKDRKFKLKDEILPDLEETQLREIKALEDAALVEAAKADEQEAGAEAELEKKAAEWSIHLEKPHCFDSAGRVFSVDNVDENKLPKLISEIAARTDGFGGGGKGKGRGRAGSKASDEKPQTAAGNLSGGGSKDRPDTSAGGGKKKPQTAPARGNKKEKFTDSFRRLTTEQPPILETMVMERGVALGHKGQTKKGGALEDNGRMSRSKYYEIIEAEEAG